MRDPCTSGSSRRDAPGTRRAVNGFTCLLGILGCLMLFGGFKAAGAAGVPPPAGLVPKAHPQAGAPSWTLYGGQPGAAFGSSVATAGDVNGDGFSDLIVGAPAYPNGTSEPGRAMVFLGSASGLSQQPSWSVASSPGCPGAGSAVAAAGDVNGDGYGDVLVASIWNDGTGWRGRVDLYLGSATGLSSQPAWTYSGGSSERFGFSLASAGDVNGDGYDDVIIGSPDYSNGQTGEGRICLFLGSAQGLSAQPATVIESELANAAFGYSVSSAGDVNGDGYADVMIGAPHADGTLANVGKAFLYLGSPAGLAGTPAWIGQGDQTGGDFGWSVAGSGDVNGDGYADVVVGAPGHTGTLATEGAMYFYEGSPTGLSSTAVWSALGGQTGDHLGISVATAGDLDGDGYADLMAGASGYSSGLGQILIWSGGPSGPATTASWTAVGDQLSAGFGTCVATAGDVNGDGFSDPVVGAPAEQHSAAGEGAVFLYAGAGGGTATAPTWAQIGDTAWAEYGYSLAQAGDINGDGYEDVIVGAPLDGNGKAYLYLGSANGLSSTPAWSQEGEGGRYGWTVAPAGDVNGDGYADVLVGAPQYGPGGRAYLYLGGPKGLSTQPAWEADGPSALASFGDAATFAGDVNGDGLADVIIGGFGYNNGSASNGGAWLFLGTKTGLTSKPVWSMFGNQYDEEYGDELGSAGDVNGDGYSDVIIGARLYDHTYQDEGAVFVYTGGPGPNGLGTTPYWVHYGGRTSAWFGYSVGCAGRVDASGCPCLYAGAPYATNGHLNNGVVYLFRCTADGILDQPVWTTWGDEGNAYYGTCVADAGDVNGDGYSDLVVGAPGYTIDGMASAGKAYLYLGSPTGMETQPRWTGQGASTSTSYGYCVSSAGDVDGDGYADLVIGAPGAIGFGQHTVGEAFVYSGNNRTSNIPSSALCPQQQKLSGAPISLLGASDDPRSFALSASGRSAGGRTKVRLEWQAADYQTVLSGTPLRRGLLLDTGAPVAPAGSRVPLAAVAGGLEPNTWQHWRLRIASALPWFPHTQWMTVQPNVPSEPQLRTPPRDPTGVPVPSAGLSPELRIESVQPNPSQHGATLKYVVPSKGHVRVMVFDASGRRLAMLREGSVSQGEQSETWNGRSASGAQAPAGVYFIRLDFNGEPRSARIVLTN